MTSMGPSVQPAMQIMKNANPMMTPTTIPMTRQARYGSWVNTRTPSQPDPAATTMDVRVLSTTATSACACTHAEATCQARLLVMLASELTLSIQLSHLSLYSHSTLAPASADTS